ncbi:MAG: cyclic nucleotide-binding domain-containing protein [Deltaproteobacteria bacterium]|jgi:CRP-like cAMP-binding protein|nr:cyclic nucleotide-binding domain-containing protein [Deltaproteobacteria bacterium]
MEPNLKSHISIAEQIVDGSLIIKTVAEFKSILKIFPNEPALQKVFSDLLLKQNQQAEAARSYAKAVQLFSEAGKFLQVIDCKLLQWRIKPPTPKEARLFYIELKKSDFNETPLKTFFQRLSYEELMSLVSKLVHRRLAPGKLIKKTGDRENNLYLVVSGELKETVFFPLQKKKDTLYRKKVAILAENQFFGDLYPFKDNNTSRSFVETTVRTELLRISKTNLIKICKKYPNIEMRLLDLYHVRKKSDDNAGESEKIRKIGRHQLPLKINLHIFTNVNQHEPLVLDCYSRDVSVDGLCVILDGKYKSISSIYQNVKTAKIELSLPKEELALKVSGSIVWSREFSWKKRKIVALGFQFKNMSPKFRGMFFMMADSICNS